MLIINPVRPACQAADTASVAGRIDDISISGDFTIVPPTAVQDLEQALRGIFPDGDAVLNILKERYRILAIQSPGTTPEHWAEAVSLAAKSTSSRPLDRRSLVRE